MYKKDNYWRIPAEARIQNSQYANSKWLGERSRKNHVVGQAGLAHERFALVANIFVVVASGIVHSSGTVAILEHRRHGGRASGEEILAWYES